MAEEDGSKLAAVSRELRAIDAEIEKLDTTKAGSKLDELAARRRARKPEAEGAVSPEAGERGGRS
jgi:hypothetical protein